MENKNPKVSILMNTFNRSDLIGRAIKSVKNQTFADWELIIVNDGSTDNTANVVREWQKNENRVIYLENKTNLGIPRSSNAGLKVAKGSYISILDDDDFWFDNRKLEKQMDFLDKNPEYVACGGGVIVVDEKEKELYRYLKPETDKEIREYMHYSDPLANSTTIYRYLSARKLGFYDERSRYCSDRDFWYKMGKIGKFYNFQEYLTCYTMFGGNTSIAKIRPHLHSSLMIMIRYRKDYPHYYPALVINFFQYLYAFLPVFLRKAVHHHFAELKRKILK